MPRTLQASRRRGPRCDEVRPRIRSTPRHERLSATASRSASSVTPAGSMAADGTRDLRHVVSYDAVVTTSEEVEAQAPERVWTIPNLLSVLRLLGVPLFLWLALGPESDGWAVAVLIFAGLSD